MCIRDSPEHCPVCGLQVHGGGGRPQLALARSDRFVRVLSALVVENPTSVCVHLWGVSLVTVVIN